MKYDPLQFEANYKDKVGGWVQSRLKMSYNDKIDFNKVNSKSSK